MRAAANTQSFHASRTFVSTRSFASSLIREPLRELALRLRPRGARALAALAHRLAPEVPAGEGPRAELHPGLRFAPPGHFYSPIPDLTDVERWWPKLFDVSRRELLGIDLREESQLELFQRFEPFYAVQPFGDDPAPGRRYYFQNPFFAYADALTYHFVLRHFRPRRLIEIGSGYSTCVALDTNDLFLGNSLDITCIEPYPNVLRSLMKPGDAQAVRLLPTPVQEVSLEHFRELEANDVLFVDSTHVSKMGSDVNRIVFEILPRLTRGVLIHFHDIFYPFEYPLDWLREGRAWNEAYLLRSFLMYNAAFEVVAFPTYLVAHHPQLFASSFPLFLKNTGGSLWMRKSAPRTDDAS